MELKISYKGVDVTLSQDGERATACYFLGGKKHLKGGNTTADVLEQASAEIDKALSEFAVNALGLDVDVFNMSPEQAEQYDAMVEQKKEHREHAEREEHFRQEVPERYRVCSLANYQINNDKQRLAHDYVKSFVDAVKVGKFSQLVLLGDVGVGKTHLACGAIREVRGLYRTAALLVEELRQAKSYGAKETERDVLDRYSRGSLLVIDEVGRSISAQDEQYMLYQIINARYNTQRSTLLVSNKEQGDFLNFVGAAVQDRLYESGAIFDFGDGASYRAAIRNSNKK